MSTDSPFIDFPASDSLTVRLKLVVPETVLLSVYWGGDPTHTLGTDNVFRWSILWTGPSGPASPGDVVKEIMRKLVWHDLAEKTLSDFAASGVLESVVRDAETHHLVLTVMGS